MWIKFLGNWSSHIEAGVRNSSVLVDDKIVLDFGPHSLESLLEMNVDPAKIEWILISHMHLDHYAGLPELLWYRGSRKIKEPLLITGPAGIGFNTRSLLRIFNTPQDDHYEINVDYIERRNVDFIDVFDGNHTIPDNVYRLDYKGRILTYTGDTAYSEEVVKASEKAVILFHEMTYLDDEVGLAEHWKHSTYSSALRTFRESASKKMVPMHLTDGTLRMLNTHFDKEPELMLPNVSREI
jgi:ribonuclease Z